MSEPWLPQPGPQILAYNSLADELYYGGAAGGGKTDLLIGLACSAHARSIIFRREHKQTKGVEDRLLELLVDGVFPYRAHGFYNKSEKEYWSHERGGYKIVLGGVKDPGDEKAWQGRDHDFKGFDELPTFSEYQYTFLNTWKRTKIPGQRTRTVGAGNPPTDDDGMWVINYWAPWIDPNYIGKRALVGELRWYISDPEKGKWYEVDGPHDKLKFKGKTYEPKSRTFIPSSVSDNMYYDGTGYESQLALLPEPLRSKFLLGDFSAGVREDDWQIIPGDWVERAFARYRARTRPEGPMDQLGVDVSRGGKDEMICTPRWGNYIDAQVQIRAEVTKDGVTAARKVAELMVASRTFAAVDLVGVGTSVVDHLKLLRPSRVLEMNGAEACGSHTDKSGLLRFTNCRALWHWRLREMLDPVTGDDLAICPDSELKRELCSARFEMTKTGIKVEDKDEIKKRLGRSPDKSDSLVYSVNDATGKGMGLLRFYQTEVESMHEEAKVKKQTERPVIIIGSENTIALPIRPVTGPAEIKAPERK